MLSVISFSDSPSAEKTSTQNNELRLLVAADNSFRWFESKHQQGVRAVALVIHGLNLRPDRMQPITGRLTESGIEVLNLSLRGHGDNFTRRGAGENSQDRLESLKSVSYDIWISESLAAFQLARIKSHQLKVPLFLVGFSLGGLIGIDLFASYPQIWFDRTALFAPALKIRSRNYLLKVLSPFPRLTLPSFSHEEYRANKGTPIAAYNALFAGIDHLSKHASSKINVPTIIYLDKKDEFVSYKKLKEWVEYQKLDQWKFFIVQKQSSADAASFHHLIIDEAATGKEVWTQMMDALVGHLLMD
jgi:esterase/lipase